MNAKTVVIIQMLLAVYFLPVTAHAENLSGIVSVDIGGKQFETGHKAKLVLSPGSELRMQGGSFGAFIPTSGTVDEVWIDDERLTTQKEIVNGMLHVGEIGEVHIRFPFTDLNKFELIMTLTQLKAIDKKSDATLKSTSSNNENKQQANQKVHYSNLAECFSKIPQTSGIASATCDVKKYPDGSCDVICR